MKKLTHTRLGPVFFGLLLISSILTLNLYAQPNQVEWAEHLGSEDWDYLGVSTIDPSGNPVFTGEYDGAFVTIGGTNYAALGYYNEIFVTKYDPDGNVVWVAQSGATSAFYTYGIATDNSGNILITGLFRENAIFRSVDPGGTTISLTSTNNDWSSPSNDIFVAKYSPDGELLWVEQVESKWDDAGHALSTDETGNWYLVGLVDGPGVTATFGNVTPISVTFNNSLVRFVAKYDQTGEVLWVTKIEGYGSSIEHTDVDVDDLGNCFVTGIFNYVTNFAPGIDLGTSSTDEQLFVACYNTTSGDLNWVNTVDDEYTYGYGVEADNAGNCVVTGFYSGITTFLGQGGTSVLLDGTYTIFIAKYNSSGAILWAKQCGGDYGGTGYAVAIDGIGDIYVTGDFAGTGVFGHGETNETTLIAALEAGGSPYSSDVWVAKFEPVGDLLWARRDGGFKFDHGFFISVDGSKNCYVSGCFQDDATFGLGETNQTDLTNFSTNNYYDYFLMKLEAPQPDVIMVDFDIHPTSWPNPLNVNGGGLVPAAILGTQDFDPTTVDPATLLLEGISPLMWSWEDVTGPANGQSECNDTQEGPDGYIDLTLKFNKQELVAVLGEVYDGDELILTITGNLIEGQEIEGNDCVIIIDNGKSAEVGSSEASLAFDLGQNYPNPFNSNSTIRFSIPEDCHVKLQILDISGKMVQVIADKQFAAGHHSLKMDASNLEQGIYYYRITVANFVNTKRMIIIR